MTQKSFLSISNPISKIKWLYADRNAYFGKPRQTPGLSNSLTVMNVKQMNYLSLF